MVDARRLGAVTLALLLFLALPGIVLSLRYHPEPALAHDAVTASDAGGLRALRGSHWWGASAVLALGALHYARSFAAARLDVPGRRAALAGLAALAILVLAYFSGTILPWDQQGWEALGHARGALGHARGAPADAPLRAIFWLHVLAVPAALAALLSLHLARGGRLAADLRRSARLLASAWKPIAATIALVVALGALSPPSLGPAPFEGIEVARPDWPFLWLVPLQDAMGPLALWALPIAFLIAGAALVSRWEPGATVRRLVLALVIAGWSALTLLGAR
ncbi:MAG TPA: hypothetical protein VM370_01850 [Candidatus Thermoplasmatota archaeon]|nr:hypothetical protein [Candidatus Thermoplasmatota archaeon]